jgi:hypothetical protein
VRGATRDADSADFQASLINEELAEPASDRLQPRPHRVGGIAYSAPAPGRAPLDSARIHKGRVLDRTHRAGSSFREGTNANWVVGLGGVTAAAASGTSRIADKASLSQFDYQRTRPAAGIAHFSVSDATLLEKAKVVDLYGARSQGERFLNVNVSAINRPAPLKSVRFNIDVDEAPAPSEQAEIGSAEWVARTRAAPTVTSGESDLGVLGSRRSARARGAGAAAAHRMSARVASENIDNLLAKLKQLKK